MKRVKQPLGWRFASFRFVDRSIACSTNQHIFSQRLTGPERARRYRLLGHIHNSTACAEIHFMALTNDINPPSAFLALAVNCLIAVLESADLFAGVVGVDRLMA